jgi:class 3 adenylate cyclase
LIGDDDIGGVNVHIAAGIGSVPNAGEVIVSSTVKDLVADSGINFEDLGLHSLRGLSEQWRLFKVNL